jgi:signal transduction histidine kinase
MKHAFILLVSIFVTLSAWAARPVARDTVRLDSLRRLVEYYENQGDYEQAFGVGLMYTDYRSRMQQETLDELVKQYEREYADNELEVARVTLLKQQALMELDQAEKEVETTRLRRQQDSITLANQQLDHRNKSLVNDIALKQLKQRETVQRRLTDQKRARLVTSIILNLTAVVLLVLAILLLRNTYRHTHRLKAERRRAVEAMQKAQADDETQNRFLLNLNKEIRQPVDDIVTEAHRMSRATTDEEKREAVEQMRAQIHTLLDLVDNTLCKVSGTASERLMTVLLAVGLFLATGSLPAAAQDNPYGIRNDFYEYFRQADMNIQDPSVPARADTLIARARAVGDGLTMCLGYDLLVGHSYFTYDVKQVKAAHQAQAACARATGHYKYIFFGWNRVILTYINMKDFISATQETQQYQEEALRLNNSYGISRGYYYMGDIFKARGMLKEAVQQYELAVDYLKQHGEHTEISSAYSRLGEACIEQGDYDKAERYLLLGVENARVEYEKINPNLGLFDLYVIQKRTDKARQVITELERIKRNGMLMGNRNITYLNTMVKYYLLLGDKEKALSYLDSIGNRHPRTKYLTYAAVGDYQQALKQLYAFNHAAAADDATMDAARLAALKTEYDNHLKERANDELSVRNALLRTEQLKAEQELGVEQHRQDSLLISNSYLQQDAQEAADILKHTEEVTAYERLKHEEASMGYKRTIVATLTGLVLMVVGFLVLKLLGRRRAAAQWQRQKEEAEKAAQEAREAELRKKNFLEQITHELRTPLNAVLGFSEVLCDEAMCKECSTEELTDFRNRITEGADSLRALVDSSLELCAIEGGECPVHMERFNLHALFHQLHREYVRRVPESILLHTFVRPGTTEVYSDPQLLGRALRLLLDNAVKFTQRGHIDVMYQLYPSCIEISVADTGCGIPPEKAEFIFQHFEKVDSFIPGIGLGLSLCRAIVTLLQGEVFLDTTYNGGSRFVIRLKN